MAACILGGITSAKFSEDRFGASCLLVVSPVQGSSGTLQHNGTSYSLTTHMPSTLRPWTGQRAPRAPSSRESSGLGNSRDPSLGIPRGLLPGNSSRQLLAPPGVDLAFAGLQLLGMAQTGLSAQVGENRLCNEAFQWCNLLEQRGRAHRCLPAPCSTPISCAAGAPCKVQTDSFDKSH